MKYVNIDGNKVKYLRYSLRLSIKELAKKSKIAEPVIVKIEISGKDAELVDIYVKPLADALECSVDYLTNISEEFDIRSNKDKEIHADGLIQYDATNPVCIVFGFLSLDDRELIVEICSLLSKCNSKTLKMIRDICKVIIDRK